MNQGFHPHNFIGDRDEKAKQTSRNLCIHNVEINWIVLWMGVRWGEKFSLVRFSSIRHKALCQVRCRISSFTHRRRKQKSIFLFPEKKRENFHKAKVVFCYNPKIMGKITFFHGGRFGKPETLSKWAASWHQGKLKCFLPFSSSYYSVYQLSAPDKLLPISQFINNNNFELKRFYSCSLYGERFRECSLKPEDIFRRAKLLQ